MRLKDIQVGKTYVNRGKGTTFRKVLEIGDEHRPTIFYSGNNPPDEPGVYYEQQVKRGTFTDTLYLSSFAAWAKAEKGVH